MFDPYNPPEVYVPPFQLLEANMMSEIRAIMSPPAKPPVQKSNSRSNSSNTGHQRSSGAGSKDYNVSATEAGERYLSNELRKSYEANRRTWTDEEEETEAPLVRSQEKVPVPVYDDSTTYEEYKRLHRAYLNKSGNSRVRVLDRQTFEYLQWVKHAPTPWELRYHNVPMSLYKSHVR